MIRLILGLGLALAGTELCAEPVSMPVIYQPTSLSWSCKMTGFDGQTFGMTGDLVSKRPAEGAQSSLIYVANVSSPAKTELSGKYAVAQHDGLGKYQFYKDHPGGGVDALYLVLGTHFKDAILYVTTPGHYGPYPSGYADKFAAIGVCSYDQSFAEVSQ